MLPRFLYHGSSGNHHNAISFHGLRPRIETGISNWHGQYESHHEAVYLTDTYATYFAIQAHNDEPEADTFAMNLFVYEIDTELLNEKNLCADEDVLTLWARQESSRLAWNGLTDYALKMRMEDRRKQMQMVSAERSLNALGTCAHMGPIPLHAITRALVYSPQVASELVMRGDDPVINLKAFKFLGDEYKTYLRWLFRFDLENQGVITPNHSKQSPMDYYEVNPLSSVAQSMNWPRFNFWNNEHYTGTARFDAMRENGNTILIPTKETIYAANSTSSSR